MRTCICGAMGLLTAKLVKQNNSARQFGICSGNYRERSERTLQSTCLLSTNSILAGLQALFSFFVE